VAPWLARAPRAPPNGEDPDDGLDQASLRVTVHVERDLLASPWTDLMHSRCSWRAAPRS